MTESAPDYTTAASSSSTLVNSATASGSSFQVTVVDPATQSLNLSFVTLDVATAAYTLAGTTNPNPTSQGTDAGQFEFTVIGNQGNVKTLYSLCTDLENDFAPGAVFNVQPSLTPSDPLAATGKPGQSAALGEIGYLVNHFGQAFLDSTDAAGLQLAVWGLEYNGIPSTGIFSIGSGTPAAIVASANAYLQEASGKSESAYFLNANSSIAAGYQGQIGTDLLKFTDTASAKPATISGTVFGDCDQNLKQDSGEPGIANVALTLTKTADGVAIAPLTTTTNAQGQYSFTNLAPGTYTVTETQPAGYLGEGQVAGSPGGTTGNNTIAETVAAGATSSGNNFAEVQPASVSGTVYNDLTGDGLFTGNTPFTDGATVQLLNGSGAVVATTVSGPNGAYSFNDLFPGSFTVKLVAPSGYQQTAPCDTYSVSLTCGQGVTGDSFDLLPACDTGRITNVSFTDYGANGPTTSSNLGGLTSQGDKVTATFTVTPGAPVSLTRRRVTST